MILSNFSSRHKVVSKERVENSGAWFLQSDDYQRWLNGNTSNLLCCQGIHKQKAKTARIESETEGGFFSAKVVVNVKQVAMVDVKSESQNTQKVVQILKFDERFSKLVLSRHYETCYVHIFMCTATCYCRDG